MKTTTLLFTLDTQGLSYIFKEYTASDKLSCRENNTRSAEKVESIIVKFITTVLDDIIFKIRDNDQVWQRLGKELVLQRYSFWVSAFVDAIVYSVCFSNASCFSVALFSSDIFPTNIKIWIQRPASLQIKFQFMLRLEEKQVLYLHKSVQYCWYNLLFCLMFQLHKHITVEYYGSHCWCKWEALFIFRQY